MAYKKFPQACPGGSERKLSMDYNSEDQQYVRIRELHNCLFECWCALLQGKRLDHTLQIILQLDAQLCGPDGISAPSDKFAVIQRNRTFYTNLLRLESLYCATSLSRARNALINSLKYTPELKGNIAQLRQNKNWKNIKTVRDILTHVDEYRNGHGRYPDDYTRKSDDIVATLDSIVIMDGRLYLGADFEILDAVSALSNEYHRIYATAQQDCPPLIFEEFSPSALNRIKF